MLGRPCGVLRGAMTVAACRHATKMRQEPAGRCQVRSQARPHSLSDLGPLTNGLPRR